MPASLSIVITSRNTRRLLLNCLACLEPLGGEAEIIVVDDASTDGTGEAVAESFPRVRLVQNEENVGYARANNQGWRLAAGEMVLLLNSDTRPDPDAVRALRDAAAADATVGVVGPFLRLADGRAQVGAAGWEPTLGSVFCFQFLLHRLAPRRCRPFFLHQPAFAAEAAVAVDWVSGAAMLARRNLLERTGGIPEHYFMYAEDVHFCRLAREAGFRVLYLPRIEILHFHGATSEAGVRDTRWLTALLRYYRRGHSRAATRLLALVFVGGGLLRLAAVAVPVLFARGFRGRTVRYAALVAAAWRAVLHPPEA